MEAAPGSFTLSNQAPTCNFSPPPGPVVQLSWTAASGATSYQVYRNGSAEGGATSGTSFTNNAGLTAGQTYTYFVKASNSSGTTNSNTISVAIPANVCGGSTAPGSFTLSNQAPTCNTSPPPGPVVQLSWTAASGATSYQVYRNGSAEGGATSGTSFTNNAGLTAGQTYTYFVKASNSSGTTNSNTISVAIPANVCGGSTAPGSFTLSNQAPTCNTSPPPGPVVQLSWTAASGATSYQVYRNGSAEGGATSGTSFTNNAGLTAGQTYTYFVQASNSSGTTNSNTISEAIPANVCGGSTAPGSFTLSNQAPTCNTSPPPGPVVQLSWTAASGATSYQVYRNGSAEGGATSGTSFTNNAGLTAGQTYTYFVQASNSSGTTNSNTISVLIPANVCAGSTAPGSFTLSNQAPTCNTSPPLGPVVQLSWTTASGATSYQVYRNGSAEGGATSGTNFTNNAGLTAGQTYTYFIQASNSSGVTNSNTISVLIPASVCSGSAAPVSFTLSNQAPTCNTSPPPGPVVQLNWTAANGAASYQVYRNGSAEGVATSGTTFTNNAGLTAGQTYTYFIQAINSAGTTNSNTISVLIPASVCAPSSTRSGRLTASPSSCQVPTVGGTCTIALLWTLQNTTSGQLSVTDALGKQSAVASVTGTSGTQNISWIQAPPQKYIFYLSDNTNGSVGTQLASVSVSASGPSATTSTQSVGVDPQRNTPGSTFSFYGSGMAPGQATLYIQGPNGAASAAGQTTASAGGSFTGLSYTTQPSSATGAYTVWAIDSSGKKSSTGSFTLYTPSPASIPTCQSNTTNSGCSADPINTATGNYTYQRTDLSISGRGMPFTFTRTYNSQDGTPGPIGAGWTHSYMASLAQNSDGSVTIRTPDGQVVIFDPVGGSWTSRYNNVYSSLQSPTSSSFILTTKAQIAYNFTGTQLTAISDRNGNTIQLAYFGSNLTRITDTAGRQISLGYDGSGHLTSLLDPLGRTLQFTFDGSGNLNTFTDALGGRFTYSHDGASRMLTAIDPASNTFLTNTYDGSGRVASQGDGMGNQWGYSYDSNTNTTTITDPNGKVSSHVHDSNFQLMLATDTFGKSERYQYSSSGNRISVQDRNGNASQFSYDQNGNVIAATDAQSQVRSAAYDGQSNPLSRSDALGNVSAFVYDGKGNLLTSTDPLGAQTTLAYDGYGQLISKTDALRRTTKYLYDANGNLIQTTDPLGNTTAYTYDLVGRRISVTDPNGFKTTTAYDANDNIVSVTDPLGNKTQFAYDANNNRTQIVDARGKSTSYVYDANYKLISTTDALGNKVANTYDKLRNLASTVDQRGNTTRLSYDSENRLASLVDPLGNTTSYAYDAAGNRTNVTNPLGNATVYTYDSINRLINVKDALGNTTMTTYDAAGRAVKKSDPAGNVTTYAYDAIGHQISILDAAGGVVALQYDNAGNRVQITDARGKTTQFNYDGMNRLIATTDPLGNVTRSQYDAAANLIQITDGNGNTKTYQYDGNRRQTNVGYSTGGSVQFSYDANGNRTGMVDQIGNSIYVYDDLNRLQSYTSPTGASLGFTYDSASNRTAIQYPGGTSVQYSYDADGRMSSVRDWNGLVANSSYDAAGHLSGIGYSTGLSSQFAYDAIGQNTGILHTASGTVIYSEATVWSPNGNPASSDISGLTAPGLPAENTAYAYDAANEIKNSTFGSATYDKNGNVLSEQVSGGAATFVYDLNNRATRISAPSVTASLSYSGDGKLAELDSANLQHRFLNDPNVSTNRFLAELDAAGAAQTAYVYGPRGTLSQIAGGQTYIYLHNLQGSVVAIVDPTGSIRNSYQYDAFGKKLPSSFEQTANVFTFLGAFSVLTVGQYSITAHRVFDLAAGKFNGRDQFGNELAVGRSSYVYAGQNPVKLIDPSGLFSAVASAVLSSELSLVECGGSFFRAESACRQLGYSQSQVAAIKFGFSVLSHVDPITVAIVSGADIISAEVNLARGTLTEQSLATAVIGVASPFLGPDAPPTFIGSLASEAYSAAVTQIAENAAQALTSAMTAPAPSQGTSASGKGTAK